MVPSSSPRNLKRNHPRRKVREPGRRRKPEPLRDGVLRLLEETFQCLQRAGEDGSFSLLDKGPLDELGMLHHRGDEVCIRHSFAIEPKLLERRSFVRSACAGFRPAFFRSSASFVFVSGVFV